MALAFVLFLGTLISVAHSQLELFPYRGPKWTNLKVTLGINSFAFNGIPLTRTAAEDGKEWTQLGSDCTNGGLYNGFRYIPKDGSIAALYDTKGSVVGMQMLVDKDKILSDRNGASNLYNFKGEPMFNEENILGQDRYVLTAYVVDPATICSTGRQNVPKGEIGNGLWLQNGPTPASTFTAPKKREDAFNQGWNKNRCLIVNGYHNFYQSDKWGDDNCTSMKPVWFFYNRHDDLMGFGFTVVGYDDSPRFQHPPGVIVKFVLGDSAPQCAGDVSDGIGFSNINVYFEDYPLLIGC